MYSLQTVSVTIAVGTQKSTAIQFGEGGRAILAIITPSALSGTSFSLEAATDRSAVDPADADFVAVSQSGWPLTVTTSTWYGVPPDARVRAPYLRIVSNSAEAADRTIKVVLGEAVA